MKKILSEKFIRVIKAKSELEQELNVKITNRGKELFLQGTPEDEYTAEQVIEAINLGFPIRVALQIKQDGFSFEIINIKDYTQKRDLERVRARLIGKQGRTKKTLTQLTKCGFEIKENQIGIIGPPECIYNAQEAVISLIRGSKQSNIYKHLEKNQFRNPVDLGLKKQNN